MRGREGDWRRSGTDRVETDHQYVEPVVGTGGVFSSTPMCRAPRESTGKQRFIASQLGCLAEVPFLVPFRVVLQYSEREFVECYAAASTLPLDDAKTRTKTGSHDGQNLRHENNKLVVSEETG